METLLWILAFPALLLGLWFTITSMGKRALSRYLSEQTPPLTKRAIVQGWMDDWERKFNELLSERRGR